MVVEELLLSQSNTEGVKLLGALQFILWPVSAEQEREGGEALSLPLLVLLILSLGAFRTFLLFELGLPLSFAVWETDAL